MKLSDLSEVFWLKVKYILLFTLSILILYIIITKFIFKIPKSNNQELLSSINEYEIILAKQLESSKDIKTIHEEISKMEFDIHMVQYKDEVRKKIQKIKDVYFDNKRDSKYFFGKQSADILQIYFEIKEEESSLKENKEVILKKLNECKAGVLNEK